MADTKITALTAITTVDPAVDVFPIVDVSDTTMAASGTTKKITSNQLLGAGGTATLASATITGDLTVDTSTLKVDSTNNRVGVQVTSPTAPLEVGETSGTALRLRRLTSGNTIDVNFYNTNTTVGDVAGIRCDGDGLANTFGAISFWTTQTPNSLVERYRISSVGVHTWQNVGGVAGTAMTLNSTGLGVGGSPLASHLIYSQGPVAIAGTASGARTSYISNANACSIYYTDGGGSYPFDNFGNLIIQPRTSAARSVIIATGSTTPVERLIVDPTGNVGVGVTPNTWTAYKALQINTVSAIGGSSGSTDVALNWYYNGGNKYIGNGYASSYIQYNGTHIFNIAANNVSGAGAALTWTQAMTLDASGNLLVGKTATDLQVVGCELKANGTVFSTLVDTTNAAASSYQLYSTGAATYRFYVGLGGTVFATNTTISAISDARLKENVQDIDVGLGAILALKPRKFDWKAGKGKDIKGDRGFIAQEFETVFPQLVDEWKDAAPEGETPYKSVRQDLIPVLVKAIQELTARVEALEA